MDAIKKKMSVLREKLEDAEDRSQKAEEELHGTNLKADEAEEEVDRLTKELQGLEDELEATESRLGSMQIRLQEAEHQADESERARRILESRGQSDDDRLTRLQAELNDVLAKNDEVEDRYKQIANEIDELEKRLTDEDERCGQSDVRVVALESEVEASSNALLGLDNSFCQASAKERKYNQTLDMMTVNYKEAEDKAVKYESKAKDLETSLANLEEKCDDERSKYNAVKGDLDALLAEIRDMNI